ncbi:YidX family protein [Yersinia pekkanenii]|uniref:Lipoprotein n=1 Tax=Yersinia pekkanenii TaxID=1288385 RepID=A0A0T9R6K6_9GAMM|nr:hypothetical protein [Yersinia pekkanenii]CNI47340.1 Uncharacterised protein [Yersinia pekkanenii]CRY69147.1 Uncharacterised protein [Yersinia pekkanenii]
MKITKSAACFSLVLLLSGCTAVLWGGNKVTESRMEKVTQLKDNVTGVFQYKNLAASVVKGKSNIPLTIPSEGIAFLGEKNIYILTHGATELLSLNKVADRVPIISGEEENTLKLKLLPPQKGDVTIHFKDILLIKVNKDNGELSPEEMTIIKQSGFHHSGGRYWKNVDIEGVIIPRNSLSYQFIDTESLGRKYIIEFYSWDNKTNFYPKNLATNIVLTPLTAAADIVFFPISIQFLRLIVGPH